MPTLLLSHKNFQSVNEEKSPLTLESSRIQLERQLEGGSIEAAIRLASMIEYKHDELNQCIHCDQIANYYLMAFRFARHDQPIDCQSILLSLVQHTIQLVLCHMDMSRIQHLPWLPMLMSELRELGKQIKDESMEGDRLISLSNIHELSNHTFLDNSSQGDVRRAIRISIYHCRAVMCEDIDTQKSITYYRKCLSVRSSALTESQKLQQSAKVALEHLITDGGQKYAANRPRLPSRTSSVSSGASSSCSMACANCGVEKRGMPVCSKCKSQYYCGVRCLKTHQPVHELECSKN